LSKKQTTGKLKLPIGIAVRNYCNRARRSLKGRNFRFARTKTLRNRIYNLMPQPCACIVFHHRSRSVLRLNLGTQKVTYVAYVAFRASIPPPGFTLRVS
jgi:hypothetical protein